MLILGLLKVLFLIVHLIRSIISRWTVIQPLPELLLLTQRLLSILLVQHSLVFTLVLL